MNILLNASFATLAMMANGKNTILSKDALKKIYEQLEVAESFSLFEANYCAIDGFTIEGDPFYAFVTYKDTGKYIAIDKRSNSVLGEYDASLFTDNTNKVYFVDNECVFEYNIFNSSIKNFNNSKYDFNLPSRDWSYNNEFPYNRHYTISNDAVMISNYFYFENLKDYHGYNDGKICGVVAGEIVLGYYDTFFNDNIVSEDYSKEGVTNSSSSSLTSWSQSPGTGFNVPYDDPSADSRFTEVLVTNATVGNLMISPRANGMTCSMVKNMFYQYLGNDYSYTITDYYNNNVQSAIENAINNNRPVIAEGKEHFVVAYGYDDDYVYIHTGWGFSAITPWSTFTDSQFLTNKSVLDIAFSGNHIHSDNYYHNQTRSYYCGCGQSHYKRLIINPEDWGFPGAYNFNPIIDNTSINNVSVSTKRLRTGYIEESFVNLSPRRQNAGGAYLEATIPYVIKDLDIEMAWWSQNEHQNDGYAMLGYETLGTFYNSFVNLHDLNLPTRYNIQSYHFALPAEDEPHGFAFYLSNLAVGDRNLGRLSLGTICVKYAI